MKKWGKLDNLLPNIILVLALGILTYWVLLQIFFLSFSFIVYAYLFSYLTRDEGIVLKDLSSKWEPGDRSGKWLKLKPDYIHAGSDLDVIIIGK